MKKSVLFLSMLALLASAGAVIAYPSIMGPTGGANLPNANTTRQGNVEIAYNKHDVYQSYEDKLSTDETRLLYGIAKNTEIGLMLYSEIVETNGKDTSDSVWGLNAKKSFVEKNGIKPAIGIAYFSRGSREDGYSYAPSYQCYDVYGVISHAFKIVPKKNTLTGSLGVNWTKINYEFNMSFSAIRPYIALDFGFNSGAALTAEYQLKNNDFDLEALSSLVLHYPVTKHLGLEVGTTNGYLGHIGSDEHHMILGLNYSYAK